ncbi:MAG: dephospho-CoA kinase [Cypionkella sp.]
MTYCLGLTGSIGMGKSTTAKLFAAAGLPVWDADATVHSLYAAGGAAALALARIYPDIIADGAVSRPVLRAKIAADPAVLDVVQGCVHPLVAANRAAFLASTTAPIVLLDIPLLFETGADRLCDGIVVVSAPADVQRDRVLSRAAMTEAEFALILSRQMPDAEKRARATWVIETTTLDSATQSVKLILEEIRQKVTHA